jgi:hypothetical protein
MEEESMVRLMEGCKPRATSLSSGQQAQKQGHVPCVGRRVTGEDAPQTGEDTLQSSHDRRVTGENAPQRSACISKFYIWVSKSGRMPRVRPGSRRSRSARQNAS